MRNMVEKSGARLATGKCGLHLMKEGTVANIETPLFIIDFPILPLEESRNMGEETTLVLIIHNKLEFETSIRL